MGLFGRSARNKNKDASASESISVAPASAATVPETVGAGAHTTAERPHGPWDGSEVTDLGKRIDLGAIWLPGIHAMEIRMEIDKRTEQLTGVSIASEGSGLQVQAFAAPRSEGIWDDVRTEIAASLESQGATVDDIPGTFGRELLAHMPETEVDGVKVRRPVRFIGADGPRWFIRGVVTGRAATDLEAAKTIDEMFAGIVVIRDQTPRAPRDLLPMTLPQSGDGASGETGLAAVAPEGATPKAPDFNPLKRGPEIQEIR